MNHDQLERVKAGCALARTGSERGTAYLIHAEWAVTCAHVVRGATGRVKLEFPWGEALGDVHDPSDEQGDVALIKLTEPVTKASPLRMTTVVPSVDDACYVCGYPTEAGGSLFPFPGRIRDPHGRDDSGRIGMAIYSDDLSAGTGPPLSGFSGSPVLVGTLVVGHLRRVLGADGRPVFGRCFACPTSRVLAALPQDLRTKLGVPDFEEYQRKMEGVVAELLQEEGARQALARKANLTSDNPSEVSRGLFRMGSVKMFSACLHAHHELVARRDTRSRTSAERIQEIFERSCELGVFRLTADVVAQIFGVRKHKRLRGKLHTMLEKVDHGHHVLRIYCKSLVARMYEKFGTFLRIEVCVNRMKDLGLNKGLEQLPALRRKLIDITDRLAGVEADLLNVHVDFPVFERLAKPIATGSTKIPGIKIHDTRMVRLMEVLLHGGSQLAGWRSADMHRAVLEAFAIAPSTYSITQLRYDVRKLRAHALLERQGRSYSYRLTEKGVKVAAMFVLFHKRVCGPVANTLFHHRPTKTPSPPAKIEAAYHKADIAIQHLVDLLAA